MVFHLVRHKKLFLKNCLLAVTFSYKCNGDISYQSVHFGEIEVFPKWLHRQTAFSIAKISIP